MARSKLILLALLPAIAMAGCAKRPVVVSQTVLPNLVVYSPEFQQEVAAELESCADCDATETMIGDYGNLRDAIREGGQPNG